VVCELSDPVVPETRTVGSRRGMRDKFKVGTKKKERKDKKRQNHHQWRVM
jgi:hypothetical protein